MKRFWRKVEKTDYCWIWNGAKTPRGYGRFRYEGKSIYAHRLMWFIKYNRFSKLDICHTCDNPPCVNPDHLFEGTAKENIQDSIKKGRFKFNLYKGHKFSSNTDGKHSFRRKITFETAEEIRLKYKKGEYGYKRLMKEYPCSHTALFNICNYKTYKL